jgi:hypothetical protein
MTLRALKRELHPIYVSGVQDVIPAVPVGVEKYASHHLWLSQGEIGSDNPCFLDTYLETGVRYARSG